MNDELDATPVLVVMPVQPDVLSRIGPLGYWRAHDRLLAHLDDLAARYRLTLVDLTRIDSFGGDRFEFYDGYHPRAENTRRIVDEILERHPHAFD